MFAQDYSMSCSAAAEGVNLGTSLALRGLGAIPCPATDLLCDLGQSTYSLCPRSPYETANTPSQEDHDVLGWVLYHGTWLVLASSECMSGYAKAHLLLGLARVHGLQLSLDRGCSSTRYILVCVCPDSWVGPICEYKLHAALGVSASPADGSHKKS